MIPAASSPRSPRSDKATLIDLPAPRLFARMSGLRSKIEMECPLLAKYTANRQPTGPPPMMVIFLHIVMTDEK